MGRVSKFGAVVIQLLLCSRVGVVLGQQASSLAGPDTVCKIYPIQIDVRSDGDKPVSRLQASNLLVRLDGKTVAVDMLKSFELTRKQGTDIWIMLLFWPGIDVSMTEIEQLKRELRRAESITWHVAAVSPETLSVKWSTDPAEQSSLLDRSYLAAKSSPAFRMRLERVRPDPAREANPRQTWENIVRKSVYELGRVSGRRVLLEIAPRPDPNLIALFPGESQMFDIAKLGNYPVYRVIQPGVKMSSIVPFGEAATSAPLGPEVNVSSSQVGAGQLSAMRDTSDAQAFDWTRRNVTEITGGGDFRAVDSAVQKIVRDTQGAYELNLPPIAHCKIGAFYKMDIQVVAPPKKSKVFYPMYLYMRAVSPF